MSSAGDYARKKLRESDGLVDSLIYLVRSAIERANIDNKSVENAVCVLRNLSYRAQEIEDPNYDKRQVSSHCDTFISTISPWIINVTTCGKLSHPGDCFTL